VAGTARNQIHDGLTHVTDILPTLLDVAQVTPSWHQLSGTAH
jgi:arylsulfatase A-like enzyme